MTFGPTREIASAKSRYTPFFSGPTPRPASTSRLAALEVVVAVVLGDLVRGAAVLVLLRHPDPAVVAERLAHQRELRLEVVARGDARGVNLRVAGVGHVRAALV